MTQHHSGARQWRVACSTCGKPEVEHLRMHSQVSQANAEYFISENRVGENVTEDQLRAMHDRADGALVVCNNCNTIREVDS